MGFFSCEMCLAVSFIFPIQYFFGFFLPIRGSSYVLNNNHHSTRLLSIYHEEPRRLPAKTDAVWTGARRCAQCSDTRADNVPDPTGRWPQLSPRRREVGWLCRPDAAQRAEPGRTPAPTGTSARGPGTPDPQGPPPRPPPSGWPCALSCETQVSKVDLANPLLYDLRFLRLVYRFLSCPKVRTVSSGTAF